MANMKNTKHSFSTNQMTPGTQVNGATSIGGSQPPRNRMVVSAHISDDRDVFAEHEQQVGRGGIFDHVAGDEFRFRFDQIEGRTVGLGQRRDEEHDEHREQRQPVPVEERVGQAEPRAEPVLLRSTMSVRLSEPTQSSTVTMTKPIETS